MNKRMHSTAAAQKINNQSHFGSMMNDNNNNMDTVNARGSNSNNWVKHTKQSHRSKYTLFNTDIWLGYGIYGGCEYDIRGRCQKTIRLRFAYSSGRAAAFALHAK